MENKKSKTSFLDNEREKFIEKNLQTDPGKVTDEELNQYVAMQNLKYAKSINFILGDVKKYIRSINYILLLWTFLAVIGVIIWVIALSTLN